MYASIEPHMRSMRSPSVSPRVRAALTAWLCGNAGVLFGYRYTNLELAQGGYALSGDMAGLFVGGSIRW